MKRLLLPILLLIVCLRIVNAQNTALPIAEKGILEIGEGLLDENGQVGLKGEWEFYLFKILQSEDFRKDSSGIPLLRDYLKVPEKWNIQEYQGKEIPALAYGTYRLIVKLDKVYDQLALKIPTFRTAGKVFVNGKLLSESGKISDKLEEIVSDYDPHLVFFEPNGKVIEVIVQVGNYSSGTGGMLNQLTLGIPTLMRQRSEADRSINFFIVGAIFLIGLYHLSLFSIRRQDFSLLFFGLFCMAVIVRLLNTNEYYMRQIFPTIPWNWLFRLEYIGFYPSVVFFVMYVYHLFPKGMQLVFRYFIWISLFVFLAFDLFADIYLVSYLYIPLEIISVGFIFFVSYWIYHAILKRELGIWIFMLGFVILTAVFLHDIMQANSLYHITGFGVFFFIFTQSYLLSIRVEDIYKKNVLLKDRLADINQNLENLVDERTKELKESQDEILVQNEELRQTQEEIQTQRDFLNQQNMKLQAQNKKIASSINSAKTIQQALFNYEEVLGHFHQENFIIYRPKDVVSGDFFWINEVGNKTIMVLADCTGHGVEGAFMTLIGKNLLDKIVLVSKITDPAKILTLLHEEIAVSLRQRQTNNNSGMDGVIVCLEKKEKITHLTFAGAKNNIFYLPNPTVMEIKELKGTRKAIGGLQNENIAFANVEVELTAGALLYLGSDGLQDQNNKKRKSFGKENLKNILLHHAQEPLSVQKQQLEEALNHHMKGSEQRDDIMMVGVRL